jgi:hypothetical protein
MRKLTLAIIITAVLAACGPSLRVTTDHDSNVDFAQFKTFSLVGVNSTNTVSELNRNRIAAAVRNEMTSRGFTEDTANPDLLVAIAAILQPRQQVTATTTYNYGGMARPWGWSGGMTTSRTTYNVTNYKNGSLIINIADGRTKALIWEGIGNQNIDRQPRNRDAAINNAVRDIMRSFPPGRR